MQIAAPANSSRAGPLPPSPAATSRNSGAASPAGALLSLRAAPSRVRGDIRLGPDGPHRRGCVRSHLPRCILPRPSDFLHPSARFKVPSPQGQGSAGLVVQRTGLASLLTRAFCLSQVRARAAGPHRAAAAAPASLRQQRGVSGVLGCRAHTQPGRARTSASAPALRRADKRVVVPRAGAEAEASLSPSSFQ